MLTKYYLMYFSSIQKFFLTWMICAFKITPKLLGKAEKREDWYWPQLQLMGISTVPSLSVTSLSHRKSKEMETNQNPPTCNSWCGLVLHCFPPSTEVVSLPASHQSSYLKYGLFWCLLQGYISPAEENWMGKIPSSVVLFQPLLSTFPSCPCPPPHRRAMNGTKPNQNYPCPSRTDLWLWTE